MLADVQDLPLQHRVGSDKPTPLFGFAQQLRFDLTPAVDRGQEFLPAEHTIPLAALV